MALDMTSFDAALKVHYTSDTIENLVLTENPFLALVPKYENFSGKNLPIPIIYGPGGAASYDFTVAQAAAANTSTKIDDFTLVPTRRYAVAHIDDMTIAAAKGDAGAFMEAVSTEINSKVQKLTNNLATAMYRGGWGKIGVVGSSSGSTITLATVEDADNFENDDLCQFSSSESAATLRDSGQALTVQSVDREAGTVTFTEVLTEISGLQDADVIFMKGDRQDSATPTRRLITGLEGWLPTTAPDSTSFFGMDRSADPVRLGGVRYAPTAGTPIDEVLLTGANKVARHGGKLTHYFVSYSTYLDLVNQLSSKVHYVDVKATATVGFTAVEIIGPNGSIKVIPDRNCPGNRAYGLDMSVWKLYSMRKFVRCMDEDDNKMLRQSAGSGQEIRWSSYVQLGCRAPGRNVVISLST